VINMCVLRDWLTDIARKCVFILSLLVLENLITEHFIMSMAELYTRGAR